jgi:hypothetical protein
MKLQFRMLWMCCTIMFSSQLLSQHNLKDVHSIVNRSEFQVTPRTVSPVARQAIQKGERPGAFLNVQEKFTDRVVILSGTQKESIQRSMKTDGLFSKSVVTQFTPEPGKIYVDPESELVMQFEPIADENLMVFRPQMHQVFETFTIPHQEVKLTAANTTTTIENATVTSSGSGDGYNMVMHFDSVEYKLKDGDVTFQATLVGAIKFQNPRIEGHYSKNDGYNLTFKTSEAIDLKVYSNVNFKKEIKEPLWGFEIEAGSYGKCDFGVFLVIDIQGNVSLEVKVDQGFELVAGVKGSTCYYVPTSIKPVLEVNNWCDIDYKLAGKITAFAGIQCQTVLKIKGYTALDIKAKSGMEGTVEVDGAYLDADLGMRMKVWGKAVTKEFTLMDKYYSFFKKKELDYGNYNMEILEACAYRDYVIGRISKMDSNEPYTGTVTVRLVPQTGATRNFEGVTNVDGYFAIKDIPMKKGDKVAIQVSGSPNPSQYVEPTIPFSEIKLLAADYYIGQITGVVAASVSQYENLLKASGTGTTGAQLAGIVSPGASQAQQLRGQISARPTIERINLLRNRTLTYTGPIYIEKEDFGVDEAVNQVTGVTTRVPATVGQRSTRVGTQAPASGRIPRPGSVKETTFSPLGIFTVYRDDLKPSERVKAQIVVEGFEIESDWIDTDGIMVVQIETGLVNSRLNLSNLTLSGDEVIVMVSALRSDTPPSGKVRIVKGSDMVHAGIQPPYSVVEGMPQLKKPFVWFDKEMQLQPVTGSPGLAQAGTGPWSSTLTYRTPADAINPNINTGHSFEMVSYLYKGRETGSTLHIEMCPSCSSPVNYLQHLGKSIITNDKMIVNPNQIIAPQQINKQINQGGRL